MIQIQSRYDGRCATCSGKIAAGEMIFFSRDLPKGQRAFHIGCAPTKSNAQQEQSMSNEQDQMKDFLSKQTKPVLVEMTKLIEGQAGDYARLPKEHYVSLLSVYNEAKLMEAFNQVQKDEGKGSAENTTKMEANQAQAPQFNGDAVSALVAALGGLIKPAMPEGEIRSIVTAQVNAEIAKIDLPRPRVLEIKPFEGDIKKLGIVHKELETLIKVCNTRMNVFLAGPAGSGKTTAAHQVSEALGLPFHFNGAIDTEYKLKGFIDAQGRMVSTAFRTAYEHGGVYLFDEVDASMPSATMAFNAALANGECDFPDGRVKRHPDFVCIAAGNTYGLGATFDYVGRNKQDAAFLDRFVFMTWDIDEELETAVCPDVKWARYVQGVRQKAKDKGLKVIISPRATIFGAQLLAAGLDNDQVKAMAIRKGMTEEQWKAVA